MHAREALAPKLGLMAEIEEAPGGDSDVHNHILLRRCFRSSPFSPWLGQWREHMWIHQHAMREWILGSIAETKMAASRAVWVPAFRVKENHNVSILSSAAIKDPQARRIA